MGTREMVYTENVKNTEELPGNHFYSGMEVSPIVSWKLHALWQALGVLLRM